MTSEYACKVCEAEPDDEGCIEHGRGCYVASADGGGCTFVDLPEPMPVVTDIAAINVADGEVVSLFDGKIQIANRGMGAVHVRLSFGVSAPLLLADQVDQVVVEIAGYLVHIAQGLEGEAAAQTHALADAILEDRHKFVQRVHHTPTTRESSVGPVTVDLADARRNGWSEDQIARCIGVCHAASRLENRVVNHAKGYTRICEACEQWTRPEGECHLCERDRVQAKQVRRGKRPVDVGWLKARKAAGVNTSVCPECEGTGSAAKNNGDGECYRCLGGGWDDCECDSSRGCPLHGYRTEGPF